MLITSMNKYTRRFVETPFIIISYQQVTSSTASLKKCSSNIFSNEAIHKSLKTKPFVEIARGFFVYNLLRFDFMINHSENILKWINKLMGERAARYLLKKSLYRQFVGGERKCEVLNRVKSLNKQNIRTFLSYAAEETNQNSERKFKNMKKCILECVNIVIATSVPGEGMTAIKISPLASLDLQKKVNIIIQNKYNWFVQLNKQGSQTENENTRMDIQTFHSNILKIDSLLSSATMEQLFQQVSSGRKDISARRWLDRLNEDVELYKLLHFKNSGLLELNSKEKVEWNDLMLRVEEIALACQERNITLLVDAEQTYIQRAIHYIAVHFLMNKFNRNKCVVYNTYQCKLKSTFKELKMDIDYAKEENILYGLKMVRGAYLDEERRCAKEMNYPDPTNENVGATTDMYHRVMDLALREVKQGRMKLLVATHNKDSVMRAITEMEELGISKRSGVKFGQVLGMCDYVSSPLAEAGYQVYKAVPYGPVMEVMPYLIRRAQENRYAMKGADFERKVLGREILYRIKKGILPMN